MKEWFRKWFKWFKEWFKTRFGKRVVTDEEGLAIISQNIKDNETHKLKAACWNKSDTLYQLCIFAMGGIMMKVTPEFGSSFIPIFCGLFILYLIYYWYARKIFDLHINFDKKTIVDKIDRYRIKYIFQVTKRFFSLIVWVLLIFTAFMYFHSTGDLDVAIIKIF